MSTDLNRRQFASSLIAGSVAGTSTDCIFFPIDTLKTRLQAAEGFRKAGGFRHLEKGVVAVVAGSAPAAALFFGAYTLAKTELSGALEVSEACTVPLPLVGRVEVCGMTTAEVEARIVQAYEGGYLLHPTVAVSVSEYRSQKVEVLGAVENKGPVFLKGATTILDVIGMAGGPSEDNVVTIEVVDGEGRVSKYKLPDLLRGDDVAVSAGDTVVLKPGEVVYVEGAVSKPGTVMLADDLTVTQAIALAGGPAEYSNLRRVVVRRADGSKVKVNVVRINRGKPEDDVVLREDDHVIVPDGAF